MLVERAIFAALLFAFTLSVAAISEDKGGFAETALPGKEAEMLQDELLKEAFLLNAASL